MTMTPDQTAPTAAFLSIHGLTKTYGTHLAVNNIDLAVREGEFVSLLGPSGCGKTTTLQMLGGFVPPSGGQILLEGRDLISVPSNRRGLGIVFQSYALFPHMTAAENIAFGLDVRKVGRADREARVRRALELVGLGAYGDRHPRRMSGGQQQRVALARALVIQPRVLLLDEPLSNLDANLREEMQIELRRIQQTTGTTTILVTHDQTEAMALSDRIVLMRNGCIEQIGQPEQVYARPANGFVARFLGKTNLFAGQVSGGQLAVGDYRIDAPQDARPGPVTAAIRPEKLGLGPAGIPATVRSRVFQGTQWLLEFDTGHGIAVMQRQNLGATPPAEGEAVHLTFAANDVHLMPPEAGQP